MANIKIKSRLILNIFLSIGICGVLAAFLVFFQMKLSFLRFEKDNMEIFLGLQSKIIEREMNEAKSLIGNIAKQSEVVDFLINQSNKGSGEVFSLFDNYNLNNSFSDILIVDVNYNLIASSSREFNYFFSEGRYRDYFSESFGGKEVSFFYHNRDGIGEYCFLSPIKNEKGITQGTVIGIFNKKMIAKTEIENLDDYEVMIINKGGLVLEANNENYSYHSLGDVENDFFDSMKLEIGFNGGIENYSLGYDLAQKNLPYLIDGVSFFNANKENTKREFLAISKIGDFPFYLGVFQQKSDYWQFFKENTLYLVFYVIACVVISLISIYFIINNYLNPLNDLKKATREVAAGYYSKVKIDTKDEFGELGVIFNSMVDKIKRNQKKIEEEVQKRTRSAEELNKHMVNRELKMREMKKEIKKLKEAKND